ncbi:MAG: response regulator transcription factor [Verrucomicrobiota bacterium]|jgi:DNA-binding NarL/FixJ family response regulator
MMRVLIVDDHSIVRRGLKEILADEFPKSEAGEAESSRAALELVATQEWDIVLLDINIPGRSGLEMLVEMKRLRPNTPVLVLSAYPEEEFAIRSLKLGASGYLNKSLSSDEVVIAVKKAMAGGKYVTAALAEKLAARLGSGIQHSPHESLSGRELQILQMIAEGSTIKEIAVDLALSEKTVGTYRSRISKKMGLMTNVELARYALKHRLVD